MTRGGRQLVGRRAPLAGRRVQREQCAADQGGDCVEVAALTAHAAVAVRDSKAPPGPVLALAPAAFSTFLGRASTAAG